MLELIDGRRRKRRSAIGDEDVTEEKRKKLRKCDDSDRRLLGTRILD